jgi:uncharacterized protein (DUF1501 family)
VVFDDPEKFTRNAFYAEKPLLDKVAEADADMNPSRRYLLDVARSAQDASALVRQAWAQYKSPVDYGIVPLHLPKVAALIEAGMPARLYYVAYRNNAFDTHVYQGDVHARLWTYTSDHIAAFVKDVARLGRGDDVVLMTFSEFGRRVKENTSQGTDHGTAAPAFMIGAPVMGGQYGKMPSLTELNDGNMVYTTDFRRLYATAIKSWMGHTDAAGVLRGEFEPLPIIKA